MFFCLKVFVKYLFSENTGHGKKTSEEEWRPRRRTGVEWKYLFVVFIKKHFSRLKWRKKRTKTN